MHLVGFIVKKFVKMHAHMNVKKMWNAVLFLGNHLIHETIMQRQGYK